jgi:hypothetical protein
VLCFQSKILSDTSADTCRDDWRLKLLARAWKALRNKKPALTAARETPLLHCGLSHYRDCLSSEILKILALVIAILSGDFFGAFVTLGGLRGRLRRLRPKHVYLHTQALRPGLTFGGRPCGPWVCGGGEYGGGGGDCRSLSG